MADNVFNDGIPLGLGMALAQNTAALERFSALGSEERHRVISGASHVRSRQEMREYVESIGTPTNHPQSS